MIRSFVVIIITSIAIVVHGQPQHQLRTTAGASTTTEAVGNHQHEKDEEGGRGGGGLLGRRGRNFIRQPVYNDDDDDDDDDGTNTLIHEYYVATRDGALEEGKRLQEKKKNDAFLIWCRQTLGIDSNSIDIDIFEYHDYIKAMDDRIDIFYEDVNDVDEDMDEILFDDDDDSDSMQYSHYLEDYMDQDKYLSVTTEYPPVNVRGLKATKDIQIGEIVLSIPYKSLWTIQNMIDDSNDPILIKAMGSDARTQNEWISPGIDDIPLLAVTILYHMNQKQKQHHQLKGEDDNDDDDDDKNNKYHPYIDLLDNLEIKESIPHLWSSRKLRRSATAGVRKVSKEIRRDVIDLYHRIVIPLIDEYPDVFDDPCELLRKKRQEAAVVATAAQKILQYDAIHGGLLDDVVPIDNDDEYDDGNENNNEHEWMFSIEKFHWAFAVVNSRHWHLQIPDNDNDSDNNNGNEDSSSSENDEVDNSKQQAIIIATPADKEIDKVEENGADGKVKTSTKDMDTDRGGDIHVVVDVDVDVHINGNGNGNGNGNDNDTTNPNNNPLEDDHVSFSDQEGPPASTPTDEWVVIQQQKLRDEEERELRIAHNLNTNYNSNIKGKGTANHGDSNGNDDEDHTTTKNHDNDYDDDDNDSYSWPSGNSFLAPVADLLNFGPPCTRGIYNTTTKSFDIIATCNFKQGQEITFWYTDACQDVFIANYGFTMPMMVPECHHRRDDGDNDDNNNFNNSNNNNHDFDGSNNSNYSKNRHYEHQLEEDLIMSYEELDRLDRHVDYLMEVITEDCHCENIQTDFLFDFLEGTNTNNRNDDNLEQQQNNIDNVGVGGSSNGSNDGDSENDKNNSINGKKDNVSRQNSADNTNNNLHLPRSPSPQPINNTTTAEYNRDQQSQIPNDGSNSDNTNNNNNHARHAIRGNNVGSSKNRRSRKGDTHSRKSKNKNNTNNNNGVGGRGRGSNNQNMKGSSSRPSRRVRNSRRRRHHESRKSEF